MEVFSSSETGLVRMSDIQHRIIACEHQLRRQALVRIPITKDPEVDASVRIT